MKPYRRILTLIDFDREGESVARRALQLARLNDARLAFLHLAGTDATLDGGYPAASPRAEAAAIADAARRRLNHLATCLGATAAECQAGCGPQRQLYREALRAWQPDLIIAARDYPFLVGPHDLLILGRRDSSVGGKLLRQLVRLLGVPARLSTR